MNRLLIVSIAKRARGRLSWLANWLTSRQEVAPVSTILCNSSCKLIYHQYVLRFLPVVGVWRLALTAGICSHKKNIFFFYVSAASCRCLCCSYRLFRWTVAVLLHIQTAVCGVFSLFLHQFSLRQNNLHQKQSAVI